MILSRLPLLLSLILLASSCNGGNSVGPDSHQGSKDTLKVVSFSLPSFPLAKVDIDHPGHSISITLPEGSALAKTRMIFTTSPENVTANPASNSDIDLSKKTTLTLNLPGGQANYYKISATIAKSSNPAFKWIQEDKYLLKGKREGKTLTFYLPYGADVSSLTFNAPSDNAISFVPDISKPQDLRNPLAVKCYAEDGIHYDEYTLKVEILPKDSGVRGVYLPTPTHTRSFATYSAVCSSLDLLKQLNFNCLYVACWDDSKTGWPSQVLLDNSTHTDLKSTNFYSGYSGGTEDAIADIISEAHKRNIKVILWFEYGFMHRVGSVKSDDPVLAKNPDWIGINSSGDYSNYNNSDYYLNAFDPAVQNFLLDLVCEAVERYPEVDGVEGDDRMPAMPLNSGYNPSTREAYKTAKGSYPPSDYQNADWKKWRLEVLDSFADSLYRRVKKVNPDCLVCAAPNKFPWCRDALMQNWPTWVERGSVDMVNVQCYVTANYENDVKSQFQYFTDRRMYFPAMILKNGAAILSPDMLSEQLSYNRRVGTAGESQFWFDGLLEKPQQEIFKLYYSYPVEFPTLK